jgi:acetylornithine deacetylase/succinyl-diaminopimelate desuccinylase-like protein
MTDAHVQKVLDHIDTDELVKIALDLGNIDSPTGGEGPVADYVHAWLTAQGIAARKVALIPERPNVVGVLPGIGGGRSLVFNSHMDTTIHKDELWTTRRAADPVFHSAWREGDVLVGNGVCNDKGPMATWLIAAKAIKDSGVRLKGDVVLMSVVGEIGLEPVDEFQPPAYLAKEAGTRYAITHGGVGDFALVGVEAGKAFFKITVFGNDLPIYTPYIQRPTPVEKNPNAIVRMAPVLQRLEEWAYEYEQANRYEGSGGVIVPRVNVGAIRGGVPYKITKTVQQCAIYVDVRVTPAQNPLDLREELTRLVAGVGLAGEVELYLYRPAFEVDAERVKPLTGAISRAHQAVLGGTPPAASPPFSSMWRDINCFNEMRIPSVTYGPGVSVGGGNYGMRIADLVTGAKLYALTALGLCDQDR